MQWPKLYGLCAADEFTMKLDERGVEWSGLEWGHSAAVQTRKTNVAHFERAAD